MSKILCTFGTGYYANYLALTRPFLEGFAQRHGYDYTERYIESDRPPAWSKILLLLEVLEEYDEALWIDSDVVIVDDTHDVADAVEPEMWQAMSLHTNFLGVDLGTIPSTGFWFLRKPMIPFLQEAWKMTEYIHHPWWEQKAMHKLLGFESEGDNFPVVAGAPTILRAQTQFLEDRWHSLDITNLQSDAFCVHVPAFGPNKRLFHLLQWAEVAREKRRVRDVV